MKSLYNFGESSKMKDIVAVYNYDKGLEAIYFDGELFTANYGEEDGHELFLEVAQDLTRDGPVRVSAPWHLKDEYVDTIVEEGFPKYFKDLLDKLGVD